MFFGTVWYTFLWKFREIFMNVFENQILFSINTGTNCIRLPAYHATTEENVMIRKHETLWKCEEEKNNNIFAKISLKLGNIHQLFYRTRRLVKHQHRNTLTQQHNASWCLKPKVSKTPLSICRGYIHFYMSSYLSPLEPLWGEVRIVSL